MSEVEATITANVGRLKLTLRSGPENTFLVVGGLDIRIDETYANCFDPDELREFAAGLVQAADHTEQRRQRWQEKEARWQKEFHESSSQSTPEVPQA